MLWHIVLNLPEKFGETIQSMRTTCLNLLGVAVAVFVGVISYETWRVYAENRLLGGLPGLTELQTVDGVTAFSSEQSPMQVAEMATDTNGDGLVDEWVVLPRLFEEFMESGSTMRDTNADGRADVIAVGLGAVATAFGTSDVDSDGIADKWMLVLEDRSDSKNETVYRYTDLDFSGSVDLVEKRVERTNVERFAISDGEWIEIVESPVGNGLRTMMVLDDGSHEPVRFENGKWNRLGDSQD
jgi:hypothetical protein